MYCSCGFVKQRPRLVQYFECVSFPAKLVYLSYDIVRTGRFTTCRRHQRARNARKVGRNQYHTNVIAERYKTFFAGGDVFEVCTASLVMSSLFRSYPRHVILVLKPLLSRSSSPRSRTARDFLRTAGVSYFFLCKN